MISNADFSQGYVIYNNKKWEVYCDYSIRTGCNKRGY